MQILTDALHRIAYATDASAYREMPIGVAFPESEDDIKWLLKEAQRRGTFLIPRAAGTSIAGQVVGHGIVMDVSRYMNRILECNPQERTVRVQPGVVRDELNRYLQPYGLFFSPETSTSNRCCIGGMLGNNSCGTHSLVYGATRHHVVGVRMILSDGTIWECNNHTTISAEPSSVADQVMNLLSTWQNDTPTRELLRSSYPDAQLRRRSMGYAIDECIEHSYLDIPALITGSEGTLAIVTEITLSLDPLPPKRQMLVCAHLDELHLSWQTNLIALQHHPTAVELMDGKILELCKTNPLAQKNRFFVVGDPAALVIVELRGENSTEMDDIAMQIEADWRQSLGNHLTAVTRVYDEDVPRVWALRKAGLGVLTGADDEAKPVGVIEDTAVAPVYLDAYMHDIEQMLSSLNLSCVYYGHISTGELHLRPILNLKLSKDRQLFRTVATQTAQIVKKHRGSLSGEHGDGRLRGEFLPLMYGQPVYEMMCLLKATFDPNGVLNMGKIVHTPPMDECLRYEVEPTYALSRECSSKQVTEIMSRIERCNGSGDCRKSNLIGGTLCPSYKVSHDELHSTRARANVLREVLTRGDENGQILLSPLVAEELDSCLACKACYSECPSNVNMTFIRSRVLDMIHHKTHTPFRSWMVARMAKVEALGAMVPHLYNQLATCTWTRHLIQNMVGFSHHRMIPTLSNHSLAYLIRHAAPIQPIRQQNRVVYLFADEFTSLQEAELGLQFYHLLCRLGYQVRIPKHTESGRAAMSKGCLDYAKRVAEHNVKILAPLLSSDSPIVGIEPSCILSFRDEYMQLVNPALTDQARTLAHNSMLYDEFLCREWEAGRIVASDFKAIQSDVHIFLHGHCHQKALVGVEKTAQALRWIPDATIHVIPSGCCGMAGAYGYEKEHYDTSMAIGQMVLFPAVQSAKQYPNAIICAPGTSCRQQIWDGTHVKAFHPIEVLNRSLK